MDIKSFIKEELAQGKAVEDILTNFAASAHEAKKEYEAAQLRVKDYSRSIYYDSDVLEAITQNELSAEVIVDIMFYWYTKECPEFWSEFSPKEVDTMRTELVEGLKQVSSVLLSCGKIMTDETLNDLDKLMALEKLGVAASYSEAKKIKSDTDDRLQDLMRKLGF